MRRLQSLLFTPQLIEHWISYKREREIQPLRLRPHPLEFGMYFDI
jgi:glutamine synthetase